MQRIRVVKEALDANNTIARANREDFDRASVTVVNLMSAPGAGKTTLLERTLARFDDHSDHDESADTPRIGIIEGDVQGNFDAQRLAVYHVPVVQINTDGGFGGECHLDANMIRSALPSMPLDAIDLLVIENVGNLVCPAEFKVGEDHRVMITSVTEGEDKPLKYPLMFRACELVVVNKVDLLPHLDVDMNALLANIEAVHPGMRVMRVSARTGEGLDEWCDWLLSTAKRPQAAMA
ncbi:MAG TPA: hydrogenase nickel incorporation protein HypB [Gemmatimonadaceae bacterium]|nr:hydrogenase nickel incorporation protein HypB [Gemmatimonadaceae bacterium]